MTGEKAKNSEFVFVAIVAIVAIVGLVFMTNSLRMSQDTVGGEAIRVAKIDKYIESSRVPSKMISISDRDPVELKETAEQELIEAGLSNTEIESVMGKLDNTMLEGMQTAIFLPVYKKYVQVGMGAMCSGGSVAERKK